MFYNNLNPILAQIGPFTIRWYGILFALGMLITFIMIAYFARKRKLPLSAQELDQFFLWMALGIIVGSRIGSIFSSPGYYWQNPGEMIAIWKGGLAFHGGLIGLIIVTYFFCRSKKISFYDLADIMAIPATIALAIGRVGNFINGEFYGTVTSLPWGVQFPGVPGFRHPTQLYEAVGNLFTFGILWNLRNRKLPKGFLFWLFILLYGVIRFPLEYLKIVPKFALGLTWGQFWCIPMVILGAFMLWKLNSQQDL
jgi:phosphatidylglycerol---prolipoprotein diacylglyceryl transferase